MEGPSRCPLCVLDEEMANHLLLLCPFAQEVLRCVLMLGPDKIELPGNISDLLRNWAKLSPFYLSKKKPSQDWLDMESQIYMLETVAGEEQRNF